MLRMCVWFLHALVRTLTLILSAQDIVELPRLGLTFHARTVSGTTRLYCLEHVGLFISNRHNSPSVRSLLSGLPHSIMLEDDDGALFVLVPCATKVRLLICSSPLVLLLTLALRLVCVIITRELFAR